MNLLSVSAILLQFLLVFQLLILLSYSPKLGMNFARDFRTLLIVLIISIDLTIIPVSMVYGLSGIMMYLELLVISEVVVIVMLLVLLRRFHQLWQDYSKPKMNQKAQSNESGNQSN